MISGKTIFIALVGINLVALLVIGLMATNVKDTQQSATSYEMIKGKPSNLLTKRDGPSSVSPQDSKYQFNNPNTAFYVLQQLDVFEPIPNQSFASGNPPYNTPMLGLKNDDYYCEKHRAYFVQNPEFIFNEINFVTSYVHGHLVRNVLKMIGNDVHRKVGDHMAGKLFRSRDIEIKPEVNVFWTMKGLFRWKHIGKHFACLSQIHNQILGRTDLNSKDKGAECVVKYAKLYKDRPQCFSHSKFFPQTWALKDKDQCTEFFDEFNSDIYQKIKKEHTIAYIRKVGQGSHRGEGVYPVTEYEENKLRKQYKNGSLCGQVINTHIMQRYIHNPLLLDGHKFDFRMYLLVASTNPTIAYYYDGYLRVALQEYDSSSTDKSVLLTNTHLSAKIFKMAAKNGTFLGLNETELKEMQMWHMEDLQEYLLDEGLITDKNWLDNHFRPEFKRAMIHLIRMASSPFMKRSQIYELFGIDFILDTNLELWFIESNSGPGLAAVSDKREKFITKMLLDQFEIVFGLLRSRMKRAIDYVNKIDEEGDTYKLSSGEVVVKDLAKKQKEFKELTKNYFEPEFEPKAENRFAKIVDENYSGVERYMGFLDEECL